MKNRAFLNGAIILVVFNLLGKVIGSVYRISLATVLGAGGMGQYQLVFPLYCLILTIATSGMPASISKLVAEFNEEKRYKDSRKLLGISTIILSIISLVGAAIIVVGAKFISGFQGNENAYICYYGIAPAVVFVGVLSAFRGYFQGNLQMFPTAISGLIEQIFKLGCGIFLSTKLSVYGTEYAVFGALLGISASEFFAFIFLFGCFLFRKRSKQKQGIQGSYSKKFLSRSLLSQAVPITLGGLILPVTNMVDSFLVVNLLMLTGMASANATSLLGIQAGVVEPLVNLPVTIAVSLAIVLLPSISTLNARSEKEQVKSLICKVFQITLSISICCALCFIVFGGQALTFLYGKSFTSDEIIMATKLLILASINIILISLVQISASVLQGLNKSKYTVKSLLIGCVVKVVLEVALILTPGVGIFGATLSGGVCYLIVLMLNLKKINRLSGVKISEGYFYVSIQSCLVAVSAFLGNYLCNFIFSPTVSLFVAGSFAIAVFAVSYFIMFISKHKEKDASADLQQTEAN